MPVRNRKPTTPSSRTTTVRDYSELSDERPEKRLTEVRPYRAGRSKGRISVRRKGGQHKRQYRMVDFKRDNHGVPGTVQSIQYDPNRSADLALVVFADGDKRYLLSPRGLRVGATVQSGPGAPIEIGNALPIGDMPLGIAIHNVELTPGRGGQLVRAAGNSATLVARGGRVRYGAAAIRGDPSGPCTLHGLHRRDRQPRSYERLAWQGRPGSLDGAAAQGSGSGDEPGRPSAWRRRGQGVRRAPSGIPLGEVDEGDEDAEQAQAVWRLHRRQTPMTTRETGRMTR